MSGSNKVAWKFMLVGSIIGLLGFAIDLLYHNSMGVLQEAIGETPVEITLHGIPVAILVIFFVVSLWYLVKKS
jgi:thiosulfate reductase cytochrome b subunit